ncbi:hypothetical protein ACSQ67_001881 [Phaseolus vulgaris]
MDSNSFSSSFLDSLSAIIGSVHYDKFGRSVSPPPSKRSSTDDNNTDEDYDDGATITHKKKHHHKPNNPVLGVFITLSSMCTTN